MEASSSRSSAGRATARSTGSTSGRRTKPWGTGWAHRVASPQRSRSSVGRCHPALGTAAAAVGCGRVGVMKLPTNRYDEGTSEREVLLAIFEELRAIKAAVVVGTVVAVPLMLLGIVELLS